MNELYRSIIVVTLVSLFPLFAFSTQKVVGVEKENNQEYLIIDVGNEQGDSSYDLYINSVLRTVESNDGKLRYPVEINRKGQFFTLAIGDKSNKKLVHISQKHNRYRIVNIPLWASIIPPLLAILLALFIKEVNIALFIGIWSGAFILGGMRLDSIFYFMISFLETISKYIITALEDPGHLSVIVFSLMIGGMVAIISKNGGMAGVVKSLSKFATDRYRTQKVTWFLGIAIFFDDYANTLIVGNTMRSVTDKFKISREKLAYIVDSTAAPVSAIAFITTWIGAELGYIENGILGLEDFDFNGSAYSIFIESLKYSFYPILTIFFILLLIMQKKEFGPMYLSEKRAMTTGQVSPASSLEEDEPNMEELSPVKDSPKVWWHAAVPVFIVILGTIFGLISTGFESTYQQLLEAGHDQITERWADIFANMGLLSGTDESFLVKIGKLIGNADSYVALLWASMSGLLAAIVISVSKRIISLFDTMHHMVTGFKTMLPALLILSLAWALADITSHLHTADFITSLLGDSVSPYFLPVIIFVLASLIAFSTGSSWSTMAILYPLAIPATWSVCVNQGLDPEISMEILYSSIATVLAASVLGDHCSPISDTTILSSLASDCNHIEHVKTQMPYALVVGGVSILCVYLSTRLGGGWLVSLILIIASLTALYNIIRIFGKKLEWNDEE